MQIRNRLFPYPVLNRQKELSCYGDFSNYELLKEIKEDNEKLYINNVYVKIENKSIAELVAENKMQVSLIIECSSTVFRKYYDIGTEPQNIVIDKNELRDKVEISSFAYAKEDLLLKGSDLTEDYADYDYKINKYDVLAIDNGVTIKIIYDENGDKKISSIFSVIKDENVNNMEIKAEKERIYIYLPEIAFNCYDQLKNIEYYQNEFFAILAIPALDYSLQLIRKDTDSSVETAKMEYDWFPSIMKAYKKEYDKELDDEEFKEMNTYEFSQLALNNGIIKSIEELFDRSNNVEEDYINGSEGDE